MGACVTETCARVESVYCFVLGGFVDVVVTLTMALQLPIAAWFRIINFLRDGLPEVLTDDTDAETYAERLLSDTRTEGNCPEVCALRATEGNMLLLVCESLPN
jgi:hypothetical protein